MNDIKMKNSKLYKGILIFIGFFTFMGLLIFIPLISLVPFNYRWSVISGIILIIFPYLVSIIVIVRDHRKK